MSLIQCLKETITYKIKIESYKNQYKHIIDVGFFFLFNKFICFFLAVLGLRCCVQAFSSCGKRGLLFLERASHCGGFSCCGAWTLGVQASVVVAHGLSSCGSQALERRLSSCGARA